MTISLIHPSRGRPQKSFDTCQMWMMAMDTQMTKYAFENKYQYNTSPNIEIILSLDESDPTLGDYLRIQTGYVSNIVVSNNSSVVEATNQAAKKSKGDILIYLSDDFTCPPNWYQLIIEQFKGVTTPMLLKVDDCLQNFGARVLTIPIMNRQLYEKLGYFWHPGYKSMFVDEDLYNTAEKLRALKFAPQLKFPHEHVCNGKAPDDETYRRSSANWNQGQEFFKQRKAAGFPL